MHLKNPLLFGLMAILLLGGTITPVLSQNTPDLQIVINEVEINSTGSDSGVTGSKEFIEIYNPTSEDIDISGWMLVPTATWKGYEIPNNTFIESQSFLTFTHVNFWFKDFGEIVTLIDDMGNIIDETPLLKDTDDDSKSWQRTIDGGDTNSIVDWELTNFTPNSSNGKLIESQETSFTLTAQVDKSEYQFGDSVVISGNVSEELFNTAISSHSPELIKISIKSPTYFKNIGIFPDRDLNFNTSINLQSVLGFKLGNYDIGISYGDYSMQTQFLIVEEIQKSSPESESETLEIFTDKDSYIPGELVILSADTNSSISFGGLDYTVTNPDGKIIFEGTIFQNERFSTVHTAGGGELYPFSTQLMMSHIKPVYGMYEINATYKSQGYNAAITNTLEQSATFNLVQDVKEDVPISLSTDKEIYSVDDVIKITGRSNDVWVEDLELRVTQTGILSPTAVGSESRYVAPDPFTLLDRVRLNGDGTFEFEFKLIENFKTQENYAKYFGDYKVNVSEYFGDANVFFKIVDNPELFVDNRTPLGLKIEKSEYVLGSDISILGKILDYEHYDNDNARNSVEITFIDSNGQVMSYIDHQQKDGYTNCNTNDCEKYSKTLIYRATPDIVGTYKLDLVLNPLQFDYGTYTVNVKHPLSRISESLEFEIKSAQSDILEKTEIQEPLTMNICKSNNAYIDNILQSLKRIGKGEIAPSMESIDCSENLTFNVGDKLVVTGKVIQKTGINLDQSSTNPSGQTQGGSSYSTNYAQAISNYVEVSIPYPKSMTISTASSVKTIPNADENYVGGGGSGEGGGYYEDEDGNIIRGEVERRDSSGSTGYDGRVILEKQKLLLTDMNYKAYPDDEGNFATVFDLRAGVFNDGVYLVKAQYHGYQEQITVKINDNTLKGGLKPSLELNLEKDEFVPGEIVRVSGSVENVYYFDTVSVKIETPSVSNFNCLTMDCGFGNNVKKLRVQDTTDGPKFFWNYKIPETSTSIGSYTIVAHTYFGEYKKQFFVVDESEVIGQVSPQTPESSQIALKIIEKFNRIPDNKIPIMLTEKSSDELILEPRVIQGSLFTSARGEESDVNLRISTTDGQCVIGQSLDCLVSESTRKPGAIYSIVTIDDTNYKIRYSGNDVRLEKFSIVPEGSGSKIDIDNWNVEIIKDDQPSRFYYKISYMALE